MLYAEFNIEKAQEIWTKEAFEDGLEQGIKQGMIIKQIEMLKRFNKQKQDIIEEISKEYNITEKEIEKYFDEVIKTNI